jgi:uncharacterized protein (TIGR02118 family)
MAKLVVLYRKPADPAAFDRYYYETHVPIAQQIPGMVRYEVNAGALFSPTGETQYHLVGILEFASMAVLKQALRSPQGQAAEADIANFAQAGVEMLVFDTHDL